MESGNESAIDKVNKTEEFDFWGVPDIADFGKDLTSTEIRVIEAIVNRNPKEKWHTTAKRIGISERRLRQLRRKDIVRDIVFRIVIAEVKAEMPEIYAQLTKKARSGDLKAIKIYLEHISFVEEYFDRIHERNIRFTKYMMTALEEIPPEQRLIIVRKLNEQIQSYKGDAELWSEALET